MAARYHPLYDGVWQSPRLFGAPFEEKGFFIFLFANFRQRPSGIYLMTDSQAAADTDLPQKRVEGYFSDLEIRRLIDRDPPWLFVRGYFKRQPKQEFLLRGAESDVKECKSYKILKAFREKYPHFNQWSADHWATIDQPLGNLRDADADADADAEKMQMQRRCNPPIVPPGGPPGFTRFWNHYPKKVGKEDALKRWVGKKLEAKTEEILAGLDRTMSYLTREGGLYILNPATWLKGHWADEPPLASSLSPKTRGNLAAAEQFVRKMEAT